MSQVKRNVSIRYEDGEFRFKFASDDTDNTHDTDDLELLNLWDEVLSEVFFVEEDKESIQYLEGSSIYNLDTEFDIQQREANDFFILNEGAPDIDEFDLLMDIAEEYFENPKQYYLDEDTSVPNIIKGFVQIYHSEQVDVRGNTVIKWKSTNSSLLVNVDELSSPEGIAKQVEALGFKWSPIIRVCFYGEPLAQVVGEKIYQPGEAKELVPLNDEYNNIMLAIPSFSENETERDSIFDFIESEIQENILYGTFPNFGRSAIGHWQYTHERLRDLELEELENQNLRLIEIKERIKVKSKNLFSDKYSQAIRLIARINDGPIDLDYIFQQDIELLRQVMFLTDKHILKIDKLNIYLQIKALVTKDSFATIKTHQTPIIELINKINNGEFVDFHLIGYSELEELFRVLWGYSGFRINSDKKDIYHLLKNNLLRNRAKMHSRKGVSFS